MSTSGNLDENSASFIGKTLRPIISDSNVSENTRAYARSILIPLSRPTPAGAREGAAAAGGVVSELDPYRYSLLTGQMQLLNLEEI